MTGPVHGGLTRKGRWRPFDLPHLRSAVRSMRNNIRCRRTPCTRPVNEKLLPFLRLFSIYSLILIVVIYTYSLTVHL